MNSQKKNNFIMIEPQCCGFEHVPINAALIQSIRLAYPSCTIQFFAETEHNKLLQDFINKNKLSNRQVSYNNIPLIQIHDGSTSWHFKKVFKLPLSFFATFFNLFKILIGARLKKIDKVIFCSISRRSFLAAWLLFPFCKKPFTAYYVLHTILKSIQISYTSRLREWLSFASFLRLFRSKKFKLIVLAHCFKQPLVEKMPFLAEQIKTIEHPYLFPSVGTNKNLSQKICSAEINFAFIGVGTEAKGIDNFFLIANEQQRKNTRFMHIGRIIDNDLEKKLKEKYGLVVENPDSIERDNFERQLAKIDYALFPYRAKDYNLVASGAFLDALSYGKPIIALSNTYFDYYFKKLGEIGYLCKNLKEMQELVTNIVDKKIEDKRLIFEENIIKVREFFSPKIVSQQIKQIIEEQGAAEK